MFGMNFSIIGEKSMNNKIRVLQVTSGISTEGIGTFVLNTYENINKEKIEMSFALATDWVQHHEQRIINQGGKVHRTAEIGKGVTGILQHFYRLIKLLKKEGPFDVVHSHMDFFNGINVLACFLVGVPIRISHAHLAVSKEYTSPIKKLYNLVMKLLIGMFATHQLGCSTKANEYMHSFRRKNCNYKVLFNGINLNKFSVDIKGNTPNYINNYPGNLNFITIGRIDEPKNPFFIVKVIKELRRFSSNIHLYWVGTGSLEKEVKQLVNEFKLSENITFLGIRDDVAEILPLMDFMLLPSKYEGLGIVLIEAQASGIPCFISDSIPIEANLGLCTVLSLDDNEKDWATKINNYIITGTFNNKINNDKLREFDIKNTVQNLESIYANT